MLIVRSANIGDIEQLLLLSKNAGTGMTTMPVNYEVWQQRLIKTERDFNSNTESPQKEEYFLVLEDTVTGKIVGNSAVFASVGVNCPFYSYKVSTLTNSSSVLDLTMHTMVLFLVNDFNGVTELGSLYVTPEYRRNNNGKLLSRSRLLMLADAPHRFADQVLAELRGWLDSNDESPFWRHLGQKFFNISFKESDYLSAIKGSQFISEMMPKYPVYVKLLPEEAVAVIGKPNSLAVPAMKILQNEGLTYQGYIDIFDAGPCVHGITKQLLSVRESKVAKVHIVSELQDAEKYIISNSNFATYRVICQPLKILEGDNIAISQSSTDALKVCAGDMVRYLSI